MEGKSLFPIVLSAPLTLEMDNNLQKVKTEQHSVESCATVNRPIVPYTGPKLIKHERFPDRKGPRAPLRNI